MSRELTEVGRLVEALAEVVREEFIGEWMMRPNEAFGGLKPLEVIERGEVDRLWRIVCELASGVPGQVREKPLAQQGIKRRRRGAPAEL